MTLILGAVLMDAAVVGADGLEFEHVPGGGSPVVVANRRKLFPLRGRSIILAVHGQNRLATTGEGLGSQRLVGDILADLAPRIAEPPTVERVARRLRDLLDPDVAH